LRARAGLLALLAGGGISEGGSALTDIAVTAEAALVAAAEEIEVAVDGRALDPAEAAAGTDFADAALESLPG